MVMGSSATTKIYQEIGITSAVEAATPHRLIQLLMERVLTKIAMARRYMEEDLIAKKGESIGSAMDIIISLRACLNHKPDEKLAGNFDALYEYMTRRLTEANFKNDPAMLDEVSGLMRELKEAWDAIASEVNGSD